MVSRRRRARRATTPAVRVVMPVRSRSRSRSRTRRTTRSVSVGEPREMVSATTRFQRPLEGDFDGPSLGRRSLAGVKFRSRTQRNRSVRASNVPDLVCGYVDPFDECAMGQKYPDPFRGLTGTFSSTFVGTLTTSAGLAGYSDLNMVGVTPNGNSALQAFFADPSFLAMNGVCGTQASGFYAALPNTFAWPNGILFTNAQNSPPMRRLRICHPADSERAHERVGHAESLRRRVHGCRRTARAPARACLR
jgi:hypothetical protein